MQPEHDSVRYPDPLEARDAHPPAATKPKRAEVHTRREGGRTYPAVCVKVYASPKAETYAEVAEELDAPGFSEAWAERFEREHPNAFAQSYADVCTRGFEDAEERAREVFATFARGKLAVYSSGRSGGWLIVEGLPDPETWDDVDDDGAPCYPGLREAWDGFVQDCADGVADIPYRFVWDLCANVFQPEAEEAARVQAEERQRAERVQRVRDRMLAALGAVEEGRPADALADIGQALDTFDVLQGGEPDTHTGNGWTAVSDSLPGLVQDSFTRESVPVLATDGRNVHVAYLRARYDDDDTETAWIIQGRDAYTFNGVTHWRALPKLPNTAEGAQAPA